MIHKVNVFVKHILKEIIFLLCLNNKSGTKKSQISVVIFLLCLFLFVVCFLYMCRQSYAAVKVHTRISASILSLVYFSETGSPANCAPSTEVTDACHYTWVFLFFFFFWMLVIQIQVFMVAQRELSAGSHLQEPLIMAGRNNSTWEKLRQEGHEFKVSLSHILTTSLAYKATQWVTGSEKEISFFFPYSIVKSHLKDSSNNYLFRLRMESVFLL